MPAKIMKFQLHPAIWTAALLFCFQVLLRAQNQQTDRILVEQFIEQVLLNNPELRGMEAEVEAARGLRTQAGAWKNPDVTLQYGDRRVTAADGTVDRGYTENGSVAQTFEFPGKGSLRKAIADCDVELAELGLQQFRASLIGKVKLLAFQYEMEAANARAAEQVGDRSAELIALLRKRPKAGVQALLDSRSLEGSLVELQQTTRDAELARLSTLIQLNLLRGEAVSKPLEFAAFHPEMEERKLDFKRLVTAGLHQNLLLKMRNVELERAHREKQASHLAAAPDFVIGPFYSLDKAADRDQKIGLSVTLPLPIFNFNQGNIRASSAHVDKAETARIQAQQEAEAAIFRLYKSYLFVQTQIHESSPELLKHLEEAADLADRHYRLGAVNVQTFLEAQRQLLNTGKLQRQAWIDAESILLDLELQTHLPLTSPMISVPVASVAR